MLESYMTQNVSRFKCLKALCLQWENLMKRLSVYFQVNDPGVCLTGNSRYFLNNSKIPIMKTFCSIGFGLIVGWRTCYWIGRGGLTIGRKFALFNNVLAYTVSGQNFASATFKVRKTRHSKHYEVKHRTSCTVIYLHVHPRSLNILSNDIKYNKL